MYERIMEEIQHKGIKSIRELERLAGLSNGTIKSIRNGSMPSSDRLGLWEHKIKKNPPKMGDFSFLVRLMGFEPIMVVDT